MGSVLALFILRHVSSIRNMEIVIIARDAKTTPTVPPTPSPAAASVGSAIAELKNLKLYVYMGFCRKLYTWHEILDIGKYKNNVLGGHVNEIVLSSRLYLLLGSSQYSSLFLFRHLFGHSSTQLKFMIAGVLSTCEGSP